MEFAVIVTLAILVDLLVGDPRWLPHPVVGMGKIISGTERLLRPLATNPRSEKLLGVALVLILLSFILAFTLLLLWVALWIHPFAYMALSVWLVSTTIAAKGLRDAAMQVYNPLVSGDMDQARKFVGYIVGRDTDRMNDKEVTRATVETVAENTVDAVIAPIFYALIGGAPLAMLYRAVNTLDSMVGYKNEKYLHFGWASARLDDVLNYIPARITGALIWLVTATSKGLSARNAWQTMLEDASKHPSPNSGIPEAAVAGALGVQLGGTNRYGGLVSERARMGEPERELRPGDIRHASAILMKTVAITLKLLILLILILYVNGGAEK